MSLNLLIGQLSPIRLLVALVLLSLAGCGDSGLDRFGVEGSVTFNGAPVPSGQIRVMPDRTKGNKGPQGYATISSGKFEISAEKGAVTGPVVILVSGGSGENVNMDEGRPYGDWLFRNHQEFQEFTPGNKRLTINVP